MARKLRENTENGIYHVYARGNDRDLIYRDAVDCRIYLAFLGHVTRIKGLQCLAFCLMHNHVHLLLETPRANLSSAMQRLHGGYAQAFNARHGRSGHVFQGRYGAVRIVSDPQLCAAAAYIARNPVEAGLCERAEDWQWGSYAAALRGAGPAWLESRRLLRYFGDGRDRAIQSYRLMSEAYRAPDRAEPKGV